MQLTLDLVKVLWYYVQRMSAVRIVLCGAFSGKGHSILTKIARFCREHGIPVYLSTEVCLAKDLSNPDEIRNASMKALREADGAIFSVLSERTLGVPEGTDIFTGHATEFGMMVAWGKLDRCALLFDGLAMLERVSRMLQPGTQVLAAVVERAGDIEQLKEKALHLALSLLEHIKEW